MSPIVPPFLSPEPPVLILDAASPVVAVGLQTGPRTATNAMAWRHAHGEAGVEMFRAIESLLGAARLPVAAVRSIVFCEGPGSLLGVRLVAMALRTWSVLPQTAPRTLFGYRSLALVAARLVADGERPPFHVISDARRATWNLLAVAEDGAFGEIRRWPAATPLAEARAIFHPSEFPHWQPLPEGTRAVPYLTADVVELATRFPLLHAVEQPDAFLTEMPDYRAWTPPAHVTAAIEKIP